MHKIDTESPASPDRQYAANTQFARLFAQFNDMTARIAALIQNQKRQSADISHELRTPLTRLQMTLALLRKRVPIPALRLCWSVLKKKVNC